MKRELLMPKLGLTMTEGSIADWMVGVAQTFKAGQGLFVVETDKVATEIVAEGDGTLLDIAVQIGETVPVGTVIGSWDDASVSPAAPPVKASPAATAAPVQTDAPPPDLSKQPVTTTPTAQDPAARIVASPYARRLARERGLKLAGIAGTGPNGRIVARDIEAVAGHTPQAESGQAGSAAIQTPPVPALQTPQMPAADYDVIAPSSRQATTARRLATGKQETPHFYLSLEAEVSSLISLRKEINEAGLGVRLTLNHFIVKAVVDALRVHSELNRVWSAQGIIAYRRVDIGVAVDAPGGLLAPAVTDVARLTIRELAARLGDLTDRARAGQLTLADNGTPAITVSNAGMHNVTYMTSIINPGQSMILGVGSIREVFRPDDKGQPALRKEIGLVLSADHRIMDGVAGLRFLNTIVHYLEHPAQLLLH